MPRRSLALALVVPVLVSGCVTRELWSGWEPDPAPVPVAVERAVRTGDGAFHVLARCHDDSVRRLVVRPFERGPGEVEWPDANNRGEDLLSLEDGADLPRGTPLRTEVDPAVLAGEVVDDQPLIQVVDRALRVEDRGGSWTLATFPAPAEGQPLSERLTIVALTPLALVADAASLVLCPFVFLTWAADGEAP